MKLKFQCACCLDRNFVVKMKRVKLKNDVAADGMILIPRGLSWFCQDCFKMWASDDV